MKKPMKDRIGDFMAGKGFYIVLFLCVAAIGISGYYLFSSISSDRGATAPVAGPIQITVTPTPALTPAGSPPVQPSEPVQAPVSPSLTPEPPALSNVPRAPEQAAGTGSVSSTPPAGTPAPIETPAALVFTWPVKGEVLTSFCVETLAYDETMKDWRVHAGLDIAADQGIQIRAAAAGTVSAVKQDALMGTVVTIDHGEGIESVYANLEETPAVEIGDSVYTGDFIGQVGSTAIAESALTSHLHFALLQDDQPVDPMEYLPAQT